MRGAWYCALVIETALAEVSFHLARELVAIDRFETVIAYATSPLIRAGS
ncbi:RES domain-containing protein [Rhizobium rhizogenes]|uniref:RES domain-containing protein n=1 Tax=Rhizobium rhizogenes TaxID=359 RepID=A0AA92C1Q0_RHIRH|nr:RES domain-containing protein [Rhizobium rhizogenes]PVE52482.1 hypothetical protein DC430_15650 [Rhizobium rhizogenes]PVE62089.1 hypothetical protein DC415_23605 [Agrobacterium tumefaciens]PVE69871.1 hypothetical protein DCP16_23605 [Sphingomonas sp. TPD3009]